MSNLLKNVVGYSTLRISLDEIDTHTYVTTDNLLQNKQGKAIAEKMPKQASKTVTRFDKGDILIANIRPYLKKIWLAQYSGGSSSDVLTFKVKDTFDSTFVYYALFRDDFFDFMMSGSKGTKMPRGDKKQILNFPIPDFNRNTQKQIAKVLSDLDAKIEVNTKINQELEAMAKTLYDYWFVQFDFPMSEEYAASIGKAELAGKPYKASGGKMVFNKELRREIPEGWEVGTIGDYCKSTGGFAFKSSWWSDEGAAVVKIKDIQENYTINILDISYANLKGKDIDDKFISKPGDVLIAMTGATVGKYAIVPITKKPLYVNQRVGYFDLGEKPTKRLPFLINSLNQKYFREVIFTVASGAAQPNISNDQINNIKLVLPEESLIRFYNSRLKSVYDRILNNQFENQKLSELRDWLLPMLMNGRVRVLNGYDEVEGMVSGIAAEVAGKYGEG